MMAAPEVWPAMAAASTAAAGPLARRLLAALAPPRPHGGDVRGRQSAAMLVVPAEGEPWRASVDLRVEDHPEPLDELERLLDLHDAYDARDAGRRPRRARAATTRPATRYARAGELAPDNHELLFWAGLGAAQAGDMPRRSSACAARSRCSPAGRSCWGACSRTSRRAPRPSWRR